MTNFRHTNYSTTHQDQELAELVPPKLLNDVHDLIDAILTRFAEEYKVELQDEGWTPPE